MPRVPNSRSIYSPKRQFQPGTHPEPLNPSSTDPKYPRIPCSRQRRPQRPRAISGLRIANMAYGLGMFRVYAPKPESLSPQPTVSLSPPTAPQP